MARVQQQFRIVFAAVLSLFLLSGSLQAQDYNAGVASLQAGDFATADQQLRPLAENGHVRAQYQLGQMHEYGRGYPQSDRSAIAWYRKAAAQNLADAQYRLGVLHENGWGADRDAVQAVHWYTKAAMGEHSFAQHDLAFMYFAGKGVRKDAVMAYMWLKIAVEQGSHLMQKHLALVSKAMTVHQINQAHRLAFQWLSGRRL